MKNISGRCSSGISGKASGSLFFKMPTIKNRRPVSFFVVGKHIAFLEEGSYFFIDGPLYKLNVLPLPMKGQLPDLLQRMKIIFNKNRLAFMVERTGSSSGYRSRVKIGDNDVPAFFEHPVPFGECSGQIVDVSYYECGNDGITGVISQFFQAIVF